MLSRNEADEISLKSKKIRFEPPENGFFMHAFFLKKNTCNVVFVTECNKIVKLVEPMDMHTKFMGFLFLFFFSLFFLSFVLPSHTKTGVRKEL